MTLLLLQWPTTCKTKTCNNDTTNKHISNNNNKYTTIDALIISELTISYMQLGAISCEDLK